MSDELKPCPFCGGDAAAFSYIIEGAVNCTDCRATIHRRHSAKAEDGFDAAIAAWNTRALPAVSAPVSVRIKPLEWTRTTAGTSKFPAWKSAAGRIVEIPLTGWFRYKTYDYREFEAAKAAAQADYAARIMAAIDAPDVAELVEAARGIKEIVEGIKGAMEHGAWRDENRKMRLKDTPEWVAFYNALARIGGQ